MSVIFFYMGVPGSGKSTRAQRLLTTFQAVAPVRYINPDKIREHVTGDASDLSKDKTVWDIVYQTFAHALRTDRPIIYDATGANGPLRRKMLKYIRSLQSDACIAGFLLEVPLSTAKARNRNRDRQVPDHVIERMWASLMIDDPPLKAEGFTTITRLDID